MSDRAVDVVASNVDIYNEDGNIVFPRTHGTNGHYYGVYSNQQTWNGAQEYCQSIGGHLATITSDSENSFVFDVLQNMGVSSAYFGFSDAEDEGNWTWVTNETSSYTNWASGEPNKENSGEDYAMFYYKYKSGEWNDGDFGGSTVNGGVNFICEWEIPDDDFEAEGIASLSQLGNSEEGKVLSTNILSDTTSESSPTTLTDLEPDTVYNYYILTTDTIDKPLTPANIQYITQFVSFADGTAEIDTGDTPITEDAVTLAVPVTSEVPASYGDVDTDGDVELDDVIMLNKYMMSIDGITLTGEGRANADVNFDDTLTSEDAFQILRYVVEIIDSFAA